MSDLREFTNFQSLESRLRNEISATEGGNGERFSDRDLLGSAANRSSEPPVKQIYPAPGLCLKFKTATENEVLFVNLCYTDEISNTLGSTKERLIDALKNRSGCVLITMSDLCFIGTKGDRKANKIDIALNTELFRTLALDDVALSLVCDYIITAVKTKLNIVLLQTGYKLWKKNNVMGSLGTHYIPIDVKDDNKSKHSANEMTRAEKLKKPLYELKRGTGSHSNYYILTVSLKGVPLEKNIKTDITSTSVTIYTEGKVKYGLKLKLPVEVDKKDCYSQFHKIKQFLIITLPIKEKKNENLLSVATTVDAL